MSTEKKQQSVARVEVRNIGGIEEATVDFEQGVNALVGRNATNRTSLLQAIMGVCGSDDVSVKGDAEEGEVQLIYGDATYERTFTRFDGSVRGSGDGYLADPTVADLFAFLLESNEARRAVELQRDLRDLIMRPIDTDEIERQVESLLTEREELDGQLAELDDLEERLPELEQEREQLRDQLAEKRDELARKREELEAADADVSEKKETQAIVDEKLSELQDLNSQLEQTRSNLELERENRQSLQTEIDDLETDLADMPATGTERLSNIESEMRRLRERKQTVESKMSDIQRVVQFNENMLAGTDQEILATLREETEDGASAITDQLLPESDEFVCWTCGTEVDEATIESTLEKLQNLRKQKLNESTSIERDLEELKEERETIQQKRQRRERAENRLESLRSELTETDERIETFEERVAELESDVDALETEVSELEEDAYEELIQLHRDVTELEFQVESLQDDESEVAAEIEEVESELKEREEVAADRDAVQTELEDLRTRIDRIEAEAVEQFNTQMAELLELLGYTNLDRIWLERREERVREGRRKVSKSVFELHVVRQTESGAAYEDTVEHLSESEREVTGLVFALAGYLTHEVYEELPFLLLDSLEAIDSERIATLIDYVDDYADFVVVALLPEDGQALAGAHRRITSF